MRRRLRDGPFADHLDQQLDRLACDLLVGLVNCGQCRMQVAGQLDVVEPYDRKIGGHRDADTPINDFNRNGFHVGMKLKFNEKILEYFHNGAD